MLAVGISSSMAMPLFMTGCAINKAKTEETKVTAQEDTNGKNSAGQEIRLEDDFYGYVNAEELRNAEIDPMYGAAGSFLECEVKTQAQLDTAIETIASSDEEFEAGSNEQLIHDLYHQVTNFDLSASVACKELKSFILKIFSVRSIPDLVAVLAESIINLNVDPIFGFDISDGVDKPDEYSIAFMGTNNILGLPLDEIRNTEDARVGLNTKAYELLRAIEYSDAEAKEKADELTRFAIEFATEYEVPDMTLENFQVISSDEINKYFDADRFANQMGFKNPYGRWCVLGEQSFKTSAEMFSDEENLEAIKTWLALSVISKYYYYLTPAFADLKDLYGNDTEAIDQIAKETVKEYLPNELGEVYAQMFYTEETDQAVQQMCEQIRDSYREVIANADWLSEETREGLLRKLENIKFITGAGIPRTIDPDDKNLIGNDSWETIHNLTVRDWQKKIDALSEKRPIQGQNMTPQTVNACFWTDNVVRITIAIVNEPFFSVDNDPSTNLGGLGMVIGHEVGHAFDSNGLNWDENGNYNPSWISDADREALKTRAQACIEYYNEYTIMDVYHVDGELTLSENYADMGSMQIITNIAKTKEEREKLFLNYAKIWSALQSDVSGIAYLKVDEHSPAIVRVNAVLSSCEAFYETYDIKEGDGMYVAPEKRVSRW